MVMQFILLPIAIIGSAMGNVYYRELSENSDVPDIIKESTRKANKNVIISIYTTIMFLALGGDKLLVLFLGAKWMGSRENGTLFGYIFCTCNY